MTDEGVVQVICRLLTDESFRNDFIDDCEGTLRGSGYELSASEIKKLCELVKEPNMIEMEIKLRAGTITFKRPTHAHHTQEK